MLARRLNLPTRSFLLLGPRGTGKTTWLRERLPGARWYNLLLDREVFRLMRDGAAFRSEVEALPRGTWVVVDEVQKLASLLNEAERGRLLETLVFHELRAQIAYAKRGGDLAYYRTPSGTEVDFAWTRGDKVVGIEVKAARRWRPEDGRSLRELHAAGKLTACHGVYLGDVSLRDGPVAVHPLGAFLELLVAGRIIG